MAPAPYHGMDYELAIGDAPETVPGGTGILLVHPSTGTVSGASPMASS